MAKLTATVGPLHTQGVTFLSTQETVRGPTQTLRSHTLVSTHSRLVKPAGSHRTSNRGPTHCEGISKFPLRSRTPRNMQCWSNQTVHTLGNQCPIHPGRKKNPFYWALRKKEKCLRVVAPTHSHWTSTKARSPVGVVLLSHTHGWSQKVVAPTHSL